VKSRAACPDPRDPPYLWRCSPANASLRSALGFAHSPKAGSHNSTMGGRGQLLFYHDLRHCLLTVNWQSPDTDSRLFKHNNASLFQRFSDACEICRQKGQLPLGLSLGTTPKKNKGWLAMLPCRERRTKSVSAEITIRSSILARSRMSESSAACKPQSRSEPHHDLHVAILRQQPAIARYRRETSRGSQQR